MTTNGEMIGNHGFIKDKKTSKEIESSTALPMIAGKFREDIDRKASISSPVYTHVERFS